jgi:hypothetical protein
MPKIITNGSLGLFMTLLVSVFASGGDTLLRAYFYYGAIRFQTNRALRIFLIDCPITSVGIYLRLKNFPGGSKADF